MRQRRAVAFVVTALLAGALVACGGDDDTRAAPSTSGPSSTAGEPLPPASALELAPLYDAQLADLGLRLTNRGGLIDRSGGGYEPSPEGTHLALYVEPTELRSVSDYIDGIRDVAVVFADVFERWPGLESYDVCQEPAEDNTFEGVEPLPVTQIELTKTEAAAIDWETVSVVDLVRASLDDPPGLALRISQDLARDASYEAIVDEAS